MNKFTENKLKKIKLDYEYERYVTTKQNVMDTINKYGVAIIPNVLDEQEIKDMISGMWDTLEHWTAKFEVPIKRNDPKTWISLRKLYPLHSMLIQHWNIGHAQFVWNIRQNPKVVDIFAKIWNVEPDQLLTSFDGASFHMPPEYTNNLGWFLDNNWLHTDQSYTRNNFECLQSWVTGFDVNDGDATLTFLEGSNNYHQEFAQTFGVYRTDDWFMLNETQHKFYIDKGCKKKSIKCSAGSMVLWDSRTIHAGQEAVMGRKEPNFRCVVYVCCQPRNDVDQNELIKKQNAFHNMRTTNHWPKKVKLFNVFPRTFGKKVETVQDLPKPVLTELGMKLAGF